jgi:uncharacterized membrane protein YczE
MTDKTKRILMTVGGVTVCGFSVGMFSFSNFGMDPFQVLAHGIWKHTTLGFGTLYMIINLVMLAAILIADRHKIGLGTFINIFLFGYIVQFSSWLYGMWFPLPSTILKVIFLVIGIVIMCFGSALYYTGDLGVSTYDAVALILSEKKGVKFQYCRVGSDLICTVIGYLLGATVGVGTLVTAFFMGPLIAFFNHHFAMPLRYGKDKTLELIAEEKAKKKVKK